MKFSIVAVAGITLAAGIAIAQDKGASKADPQIKTNREKASYGVGLRMGQSLRAQSVDVDLDLLARGIKDGLEDNKQLLSSEEIAAALQAFQGEIQQAQASKNKVEAEKNKKEGEAFLAANKKKEGVKTTKSGLQYKVIKEGTGKTPKATDTVTTNYRGTLINGKQFDSSYDRGQPASFPVTGVIPGWTEALQMMKVGSKWQLFIPAELAYGENPRPGGPIPPNATLIFDIELLDVK